MWGIVSICFIGIAYLVLSYLFLDFYVDYWWFSSLNYESYFLLRMNYRYITFLGVFLAFFLIFFLNFWLASRFIGGGDRETEPKDGIKRKKYRELLTMFQSGSLKVYTPLSVILAIPIALPFFEQWEKGLLFFFGRNSGLIDPTFKKDISYFLFSLPIYTLIQNKLLIAFTLLLVGIFILYYIERRILKKDERNLPRGAKIHLSLLFVLAAAIQGWWFFLQRYALVYTDKHQPKFFGPGFVEMNVDVPFFWCSLTLFAVTNILLLYYLHRRKGLVALLVSALLLGTMLWMGGTGFIQNKTEEWVVKPNALAKELPYINENIQATLGAYGLRNIETRNFDLKRSAQISKDSNVIESLHNVPVWDQALLDDVYKQLQGIRPYYAFPSVDVDRYMVSNLYQQVYLAARELDLSDQPDDEKNWTNKHLQYTHGYGFVMTPAAQGGDETMTWFVRDIPTQSDVGFKVETPGIYYGKGDYTYVIVPNELGEIDYPLDEGNALSNYEGKGGIDISSMFRQLALALYCKDRNIVLTSKTNSQSRLLLHRNITDRVRKLAPFFELDNDPYVVATEKGLFWIQDGYTVSDRYPNSQSYNGRFNYIRNSVKIVIDAYHGDVAFYLSDPQDPIVQAYQRIYPGLIQPLEKMPAELRAHLRYPKDLFEIQMNIFAKYHQTNPETFFQEEDSWELSKMFRGNQEVSLRPYYLTINMFSRDKHEFLLLSPMSPMKRNNLRALALAGCDGDNYGKILLYSFPKGQQVYGPAQIDTLIDQDTEIAQQLTLWDQAGSEVIRGRMIILPVGNMILYVQPVYLSSATRLKIPELKRLIVSEGEIVAMAPSLEEAFQKLENKLLERAERQKKRFQTAPSPPPQEPANTPPAAVESKPAEPEKNTSPPPAEPTPDAKEAAAPAAGPKDKDAEGAAKQPAMNPEPEKNVNPSTTPPDPGTKEATTPKDAEGAAAPAPKPDNKSDTSPGVEAKSPPAGEGVTTL